MLSEHVYSRYGSRRVSMLSEHVSRDNLGTVLGVCGLGSDIPLEVFFFWNFFFLVCALGANRTEETI